MRGHAIMRTLIVIFILVSLVIINGCAKKEIPEKDKVELTWSCFAYPEYDRVREKECKLFQELHPNVLIKYQPLSGGGAIGKILSMAAAGVLPDIFTIPGLTELDFAKRGILLDITPYIEKDKDYFAQIPSYFLEFMRYKDGIYGLPNNVGIHCSFYNKKLFDKAGIPYPSPDWAWDEFLEVAKKLTIEDSRGVIVQFGTKVPDEFHVLANSFGGEFWNKDKTRCIFNSPHNIKAAQFYRDLFDKYRVAAPPIRAGELGGGLQGFLIGKVAISLGGSFDRMNLRFADKEKVDWGIAPLPVAKSVESRPLFRYLRIGISAKTKYPEVAVEFLKFVVRPEGIKWLIEKGDSLPLRKQGLEMDYFMNEYPESDEDKKALLSIISHPNPASYYNYIGHPDIPMQLGSEILQRSLEEFEIGKLTAQEFTERVENEFNKLLSEK